jgi:hypothetical protein
MDNYPDHLAPEFEDSGAVKTPFDIWWTRVQPSFPYVPENVAREWLHRHWKHSPYAYLTSANYRFELKRWPKLAKIRTLWSDFKADNAGALRKGEELTQLQAGWMPWVPRYMLEHRRFPEPIIVLDNRDGHHNKDYPAEDELPRTYVLVEGHTRFNTGIFLQSTGQLDVAEVWLMKKIPAQPPPAC